MGVDNVLGAAGAFDLVVVGLLVSVPIVVVGGTVVLKRVERFPIIIKAGAAVLAFTAARMVVSERLLALVYGGSATLQTAAQWTTCALAIAGVLAAGWWTRRRARLAREAQTVQT